MWPNGQHVDTEIPPRRIYFKGSLRSQPPESQGNSLDIDGSGEDSDSDSHSALPLLDGSPTSSSLTSGFNLTQELSNLLDEVDAGLHSDDNSEGSCLG